jgi:hypothetical protein
VEKARGETPEGFVHVHGPHCDSAAHGIGDSMPLLRGLRSDGKGESHRASHREDGAGEDQDHRGDGYDLPERDIQECAARAECRHSHGREENEETEKRNESVERSSQSVGDPRAEKCSREDSRKPHSEEEPDGDFIPEENNESFPQEYDLAEDGPEPEKEKEDSLAQYAYLFFFLCLCFAICFLCLCFLIFFFRFLTTLPIAHLLAKMK